LNRPTLTTTATTTTSLASSGGSESSGANHVRNASREGATVRPFSGKETAPNNTNSSGGSGVPVKASFQTTRTMRPSGGEAEGPARTRAMPIGVWQSLLVYFIFVYLFCFFLSLCFFIINCRCCDFISLLL
jgi:hypothetical protein